MRLSLIPKPDQHTQRRHQHCPDNLVRQRMIDDAKNLRDDDPRIGDERCQDATKTIATVGRRTLAQMTVEGTLERLPRAGVEVMPDICWCLTTEPVFPISTDVLMTNSGKYAHYGKGLTGRDVRFGSLQECARAAVTGRASAGLPWWLWSEKQRFCANAPRRDGSLF
ncbi:MAG: aconitase X [Paracoccaceae bacterium]